MSYRTVVMYMEIGCFVVCVSGWILVCSTMPTDIWTWSQIESRVLTSSHYFSNLWKDCISDSTGVIDCKNIPSLLALNFLVLVGMKCTKIGGSEIVNAKLTFAGGMNYLIGGLCSMTAFSYYGNKLRAEFQDPTYKAEKFEIGVGVFIGWGGSTLLVVGGLIYSIFAGREGFHSRSKRFPEYQFPDAYRVVPTKKRVPFLARTEMRESRKPLTTSSSRGSSISGITTTTNASAVNAYV
ncbi:claudin-10-like isoform X2 [Etheostoma cragini]|uniref:claudin-10-like isoform X2 n=1 Tax=Etheostoma cragini TaxID=417921 RepID=UPI00155E02D3|nr:claudin-10-like isoform X2 [Etheostoma cragini]